MSEPQPRIIALDFPDRVDDALMVYRLAVYGPLAYDPILIFLETVDGLDEAEVGRFRRWVARSRKRESVLAPPRGMRLKTMQEIAEMLDEAYEAFRLRLREAHGLSDDTLDDIEDQVAEELGLPLRAMQRAIGLGTAPFPHVRAKDLAPFLKGGRRSREMAWR